jgi:hypothetical protein
MVVVLTNTWVLHQQLDALHAQVKSLVLSLHAVQVAGVAQAHLHKVDADFLLQSHNIFIF